MKLSGNAVRTAKIVGLVLLAAGGLGSRLIAPADPLAWNPRAAAAYLDSRTLAWTHGGAMDHGTFCISCHTGLPYAVARPAMRSAVGESSVSPVEQQLLTSVTERVKVWSEVQPYLGDKGGGPGTESVLNALILVERDARVGRLTPLTRDALKIMWSMQSAAGSWPWINAGNEPWEAGDSVYWGVTLAVVATAEAPDGYRYEPSIQDGLKRLEAYLQSNLASQSMFNRLEFLLADAALPGLATAATKSQILADLARMQAPDGGWNTAELIPSDWKRHDGNPIVTSSDGFATGLAAVVLEKMGNRGLELTRALAWLAKNQDKASGAWLTLSPNSRKDFASDSGKFMTDAGTAYASLALADARP